MKQIRHILSIPLLGVRQPILNLILFSLLLGGCATYSELSDSKLCSLSTRMDLRDGTYKWFSSGNKFVKAAKKRGLECKTTTTLVKEEIALSTSPKSITKEKIRSQPPTLEKEQLKPVEPNGQASAKIQKGGDAYDRGQYQAAFREWRSLAEDGNAYAQYNLGMMYEDGLGVAQSDTEAAKWYRKSAEQGHARGQFVVGLMHENGFGGVAQSDTEAAKWYRKSAKQGEAYAQIKLGDVYKNGLGVAQSDAEAVKWYRKAAEQADPIAQEKLGYMYKYGVGVAQSDIEAAKWYRKSAEQGHVDLHSYLNRFGDWTQPKIMKAESKPGEPANQVNADDSERVKELEKRLALLQAQTKRSEQAIASDNAPPIIRITSSATEGLQARISAEVTDNVSVGEVTLNGSLPKQINGSTYYWETFIPSEGLSVLIEAVDQSGLMSRKSTRIEREKKTETVTRLAAVNPLVGPKQKPSRDRAALIIGLEKYASAPSADFASRDAQMFADYAREKLGIPDNNIKILTDSEAEETAILRALKVWLPKAVKPDNTDLYVFYAGHGMPTADGSSAYLVPYDGDIQLLEDTAISRKRFFDEISATKPRSAIFFFDNCYSGATRSEQQLLAARPLTIKVEETDVPDNYLVFAAGETDQIAGVEPEVKHGRFSYFVFKGLEGEADANQDGKISAGELHTYVRESVGRFSAGAQTPTMLGDAGIWVVR